MRALIFDSGMLKVFWSHAAKTASYIRNRSVKVRSVGRPARDKKAWKTPYELWTGKKLYLENLKVWGCECWIHVSKNQDTDKLNLHEEKGIFIDYTEHLSQYLI